MVAILIFAVILTTAVIALTLDPEVKRCEYCHGPVTLKELWSHMKKCRPGSKSA